MLGGIGGGVRGILVAVWSGYVYRSAGGTGWLDVPLLVSPFGHSESCFSLLVSWVLLLGSYAYITGDIDEGAQGILATVWSGGWRSAWDSS